MNNFKIPHSLFIIITIFLILSGCSKEEEKKEVKEEIPPLTLKGEVDKVKASTKEDITYTVTLERLEDITTDVLESEPNVLGLRIVNAGTVGPDKKNNFIIEKKWYKLRADIVGSYIIPPVKLKYKLSDGEEKEAQTSQIFIEIVSPDKKETTDSLQDILDVKPVISIKEEGIKKGWIILIIAGFIALVGLGIYLYFSRKEEEVIPPKPAHVIAYEELEKLKKKGLIEAGNIREFYFEISAIFRKYLERRFKIPFAEWTTEEIIGKLKLLADVAENMKKLIKEFLTETDLVKFAKFQPSNEQIEGVISSVYLFVDATKEQIEEEEEEE